jgi:hypothetical protein
MIRKFIILTEAQARALKTLINRLFDYPQSQARHEAETTKINWRGAVPLLARTLTHGEPRKHPTLDLWAYPIDGSLRKLWQAYQAGELPKPIMDRIAALTNAQRIAIRDAVRDAVDLTDDWKPASPIG